MVMLLMGTPPIQKITNIKVVKKMETESNLPEPVEHKHATDLTLMIRALGIGAAVTAVVGVVYAFARSDIRPVIGFVIAMLVAICIFMAAVLCIELYRTSPWSTRERGKTK